MKIIDLRCRPAYLHDFFGATPGSKSYETARWLNRRVGTRGDDEHFARSLTPEGFVKEVKDAGLTHAVVVGRHTPTQHISNDFIHEITTNEEVLLGVGAVDPDILGVEGALLEIDRLVNELGLVAVNIEPGFADQPKFPDDPIYFPIYERCVELGIPVSIMSGPTTPNLKYNNPDSLAQVAQAFPYLSIICYHGYYPNVNQAIGLAFRYENIHLVPDMYLFQAGSQGYIDAANTFLSEQLLFGSSYPFRPIKQSIEDFLKLGFKESVLDKLLYENAKRVLKV